VTVRRRFGRPSGDGRSLPGQYLVSAVTAVDGVEVDAGGYLLAPRVGRAVPWGDELTLPPPLPETVDVAALDDLADGILAGVHTWSRLVLAVPVVAWGLSEMASLTPADQHIGRYLPNLATVLHRPIARLNEIRELTPIGRVRRPARGAEARLASHSEDWHRRRFRSVEPKRLLARRLELDHDLYENRVAVALADPQLPRYLVRRLAEIERLEQAYGDALEAVNVGSHHRRRRIFSLWSEEFTDAGAVADARDQARTTATYLRSLLRRVNALRGTPLARELRGQRPPGRTLRLTNVLVGDQHYRRVATLWREVVERQTRPRSDRERMAQLQRRHQAMAGFVASLIARNLDTLGYRPGDDDVTVDAGTGPIWLTGPWGRVSFTWDRDDVVTLSNGERTTRLVPIACDLQLVAEERGLESTEPVVLVSGDEVVVHLAPSTGSPQQMSDDALVGSGSTVAVSPVEATSLERVGRHVFRAVAEAPLRAYPPALRPGGERVPARLRPLLAEFAPFEDADEQLWLRRPLDVVTQQDLAVFRERLERAGRGFGGRSAGRVVDGGDALRARARAVRRLNFLRERAPRP
jgi:hypothetical protein